MPDSIDEPKMRWVFRYEGGNLVARREPDRPPTGWVFDTQSFNPTNPERDLMICSISKGRDDFGHAGFRLSDNERIFNFELGRPCSCALTDDEKAANPHCDEACVFLIVDRALSDEQRQLIMEWLQAKEDEIVAWVRRCGKTRKHQLMRLKSVSQIDGY